MFIKNIIRSIISILLPFAIILNCGCQNTEDSSKISDSGTSSASQESINENTDKPDMTENSDIVTTPAVTTEKTYEPIPDEWIPIYDTFELLTHVNSVMNVDTSGGDMSEVICALVNRHQLYLMTIWRGYTLECDWDNPITYGDEELTLYPVSSVFLPDYQSIYDLVYDTYTPAVAERHWTGGTKEEPRLRFAEIDGKTYVNPNAMINVWGSNPFSMTGYIEITNISEDRCDFLWHAPDVEGLNEPDKYAEGYFYEGHYKALYIDGAWRLDGFLCNW